jgi:hypothetical protein
MTPDQTPRSDCGAANATLTHGAAHFAGWAGAAVVNAVAIMTLTVPYGGISVRLMHHLYSGGQLLALGLLTWLAIALWERYGAADRFAGLAMTAATAVGAGLFVLPQTLRAIAERIGYEFGRPWEEDPQPQLTMIIVFFALSVPVAAFAAQWLLKRLKNRWPLIGFSIVALCINESLPGSRPGVHLFVSWSAVTIAGVSLRGLDVSRLGRWPAQRRRLLLLALSLPCAASMLVWPSARVALQMFRTNGAVAVPQLARLRWRLGRMRGGSEIATIDTFSVPARERPSLPEHPIFLLLTIDAVRADAFADESNAEKFPHLKRLQAESVSFTQARSSSPGTLHSMVGLFTSRYHSQLPWVDRRSNRPMIKNDPSYRLTDSMAEAGIQTVSVISEWRLANSTGVVGSFQEQRMLADISGPTTHQCISKAAFDFAIPRLLKQDQDKTLFFFSHLMDPHEPYDLGEIQGTPQERWIAELAYADSQFGRLRKELEDGGQWDRVVLLISSDHGEGFGQHDCEFHLCNLYEELIRVPLFIRVPGVEPRTVDARVSLLDLGPTIRELMGLSTPPESVGESLVPYLLGQTPVHRRPIAAEGDAMIAMVTDENLKVIIDERRHLEEIYDLAADPREENNIRDDLGARGDTLIRELQAYFHTLAPEVH